VLPSIKGFLLELSARLGGDYEEVQEKVWIGKGTAIDRTVLIKGPAIIGHECELRQGAYIRENVIIGDGCVIGNSSEVKNAILFNKVQIPHFNYAGDSILGYKAHMGAGVILSNFKSTGDLIKVKTENGYIETGLRKFGAILGDNAEIGCNSVLNPGTVIGRESIIYPLSSVRGFIPERHILKNQGELTERK
jgi:NDP-sugar pyrophosphorylase family protein